MNKFKTKFNKEDLQKVFTLFAKQPWILSKDEKLYELLGICETSEHKELIFQLLSDFHFLSYDLFKVFLESMADFIITESKFTQNTTQISALAFDGDADSSQSILQAIKVPLYQQDWSDVKTVNRFGEIIKNHKRGLTQIILVDEFVGSGSTVRNRIEWLQKNIDGPFELKLCFIAGMKHGIEAIEEFGYEIFCPLIFQKGISEKFNSPEREDAIEKMKFLETKLAQEINNIKFEKYSFGYNAAEALYSLEGQYGNTPNSVFPIFWWPRLQNGQGRNTLLTRAEKGLK